MNRFRPELKNKTNKQHKNQKKYTLKIQNVTCLEHHQLNICQMEQETNKKLHVVNKRAYRHG